MIFLLFQVGDLFEGKFNWAGILVLLIFFIMTAIIVGLGVLMIYKSFFSKSENKRDDL